MKEKETVGPGKFVRYAYTLYNDANKEVLFKTPEGHPDEMVYGVSQEVVPGLIAALKDLAAGDKFNVTLPPAAAFGERYPDNVVTLEKDIFMRDGEMAEEVVVGAELPMQTAEGFRILGRVISIDDNGVTMDFNHPYAGLTVTFDGNVTEVRDATPDELQPAGGCHCGGGCGNGDCGNGECGDHEGGCCGDHAHNEGGCCGGHGGCKN